MKKVTLPQMNAIFNKYMNKIVWVYQGDPAKVDAKLFTQTTVKPALPKSKVATKKKD
jgi:hypothetical protein